MTVTSGIGGISDLVRVWAGKTPDKAALIDTDRVVTYAQLDDRSNCDAGTHDENGNLFLVDRLKDMIVSGGENIYSAEVERALSGHPSVVSVAVVGVPDEKWGERVVAFVVPHPGRPVEVPELVSHCRGMIAGYKVPKEIHLTDALPLTATGKVQKTVLRQQLREERRSETKSS